MKRDYSKERAAINRVRNRVQEALDAIAAASDDVSTLKLGKVKFDDSGFQVKLEATFKGALSKEERRYEELRKVLALPDRRRDDSNFKPGMKWDELPIIETPGIQLPPLGSYVSMNGSPNKVRIVGARDGRTVYDVITVRSDGKRTCYRAADIARVAAKQCVL